MKKVNIVGKSSDGVGAPPCSDKYETWGINDLCLFRSVDKVFDMHDFKPRYKPDDLNNPVTKIVNHVTRYNIPIITLDKYDFLPTSISFPLSKVREQFGTDYFSCTMSYMMAYAILEDVTEISMYGINMRTNDEYMYQKPALEYWIGYARGKGIKVNIKSPKSYLMCTPDGLLYGYLTKSIFHRPYAYNIETNEIWLSPFERITLLPLIPRTGDSKLMKEFMKYEEQVRFNSMERTDWGIKLTSDSIKWDKTKSKDKKIRIPKVVYEIIVRTFKEMNDSNTLTPESYPLWEKFVQNV